MHMQLQITDSQSWITIEDGDGGTRSIEADYYSEADHGPAVSREIGYGVRLSAPGYLDCTEWAVFADRGEAYAYAIDDYPDEWREQATIWDRVEYDSAHGAWYSGDGSPVEYGGTIFVPGDDIEEEDESGEDVWAGWHYVTAIRIEPLGEACGEPGVMIERLTVLTPDVSEYADGWHEWDRLLSALQCCGVSLDDFCAADIRDRWIIATESLFSYGRYEADVDPYSGRGRGLYLSREEADEAEVSEGDDFGFGPVTEIIANEEYEESVMDYALDLV